MTKVQIQLEVCKAMLNSTSRVYGCDINENEFAVTVDGYRCFVLSNNEIIFNKDKICRKDFSKIFENAENDVELKPTQRMLNYHNRLAVQYKLGDKFVYADAQVAKSFSNFKLYGNGTLSRIIAKDNFDKVIGIFMPIRVVEDEL